MNHKERFYATLHHQPVDPACFLVRIDCSCGRARVLNYFGVNSKELSPTGLIISPSHEAILPDIAPANIEALFNALKTAR